MHLRLLPLLPVAVRALNIVSSNDDGWAEANIRALHDSLNAEGHSVLISAPADNQSGKGSLDTNPSDRSEPCEYQSCPGDNGPYGHNATDPSLNWVNSFPVTSMRYGIDHFAPSFFNAKPDLAVSGPNVGSNLGLTVFFSGTVGAASHAVHEHSIPALAFSGRTSDNAAWNASDSYPLSSRVYAELATEVTERIVQAGKPYLPDGVYLNVNFPKVSESECSGKGEVKYVLSRIFDTFAEDDVETCGSKKLPSETSVVHSDDGCFASISVGLAETKKDADSTQQAEVLHKLGDLVTCLP